MLYCCSFAKSCPTRCNPMDCSTPGFPVLHHLPVCSNSCPLSRWCHPTISSSVSLFSSCLQSFPASGSFPVSRLFTSGGQSIGASASASVLPINIRDWFPLGLAGLISLLSKGLWRVFSNTTVQKHQFFGAQPPLWSNSHIHTWLLEKPQLWLYGPLSAKWCLCFLMHCQGPAPVDPGWFKGVGTALASLEKYIFNYGYRGRLETDSVVGDNVVKEAE